MDLLPIPLDLPILDILYKWYYIKCSLLGLASFTQHVSKVHPY